MVNLFKYVKVYKKSFNKEFCEDIIILLNNSKIKKRHMFYTVDKKSLFMGKDPLGINLEDNQNKYNEYIMNTLRKIIYDYISNLKMKWFRGWSGYSFPKFLKYSKNESMKLHCDHINGLFINNNETNGVPILTLITLLNESFLGGELFLINKKIKLTVGDTIVFPSNFLYPHKINKINKGKRYSMSSWVW